MKKLYVIKTTSGKSIEVYEIKHRKINFYKDDFLGLIIKKEKNIKFLPVEDFEFSIEELEEIITLMKEMKK